MSKRWEYLIFNEVAPLELRTNDSRQCVDRIGEKRSIKVQTASLVIRGCIRLVKVMIWRRPSGTVWMVKTKGFLTSGRTVAETLRRLSSNVELAERTELIRSKQ